MLALLRNGSAVALRLAAIALCIALTGCAYAMKSDARFGRLTTSEVNPKRATIVMGVDASYGPVIAVLERYDPPSADGHCSAAWASTPKGSTGMTYLVFSVPPGLYASTDTDFVDGKIPTIVIPGGKQTYVGDFVGTPEGQKAMSDMDQLNRIVVFRQDIAAAKVALRTEKLELAEAGPSIKPVPGWICAP